MEDRSESACRAKEVYIKEETGLQELVEREMIIQMSGYAAWNIGIIVCLLAAGLDCAIPPVRLGMAVEVYRPGAQ